MAETKDTIIDAIKNLISENGGKYSDYYVGITDGPKERLFEQHKVSKNGIYDYWEALNANSARAVEKYCINQFSTDGGTGGGDDSSKFVYAYKKTSYTDEDA
ncbi:hypothetical protein KKC83_05865 [Patescibacteria group bacterium]|nr:hypothetical protein [Candidatus Falkowbacteria bacterium]MBU3905949.1 hypothetical protein [Patescibacteria group bacterium]MCG2698350.1 hypothetical protein [Candidatus Parcubacteria bacterium]MBU4027042.1 hypothetical protein [Patescibacteria group bacterium]MBU4073251.1 hypothetical protein [Patescibacteria group bacterium]